MPNLADYASLLERLQSPYLAVEPRRCISVRNRNARCDACARACTSGCISVQDNELAVDASKCIGCATCATACPTEAIQPRLPRDRELFRSAARSLKTNGDTAVFACERIVKRAEGHIAPDSVVQVTCLGRIEESLIVLLAASGARHVRLVCDDCPSCPCSAATDTVRCVVDAAACVLDAWGSSCSIKMARTFPAVCRLGDGAGYDLGRREFLATVRDGAKEAAADVAEYGLEKYFDEPGRVRLRFEHVGEDGMLSRHVPARRDRLLDGLEALGEPSDVMLRTRLWGHVVIDEQACRHCRMCAVFCPTGALAKYQETNSSGAAVEEGLVHTPGVCVQCRCCEKVCPAHALTVSDEVFAVDMLDGEVDWHSMGDAFGAKGGPDAIRESMKGFISGRIADGR